MTVPCISLRSCTGKDTTTLNQSSGDQAAAPGAPPQVQRVQPPQSCVDRRTDQDVFLVHFWS
jgi:hypothetical protein